MLSMLLNLTSGGSRAVGPPESRIPAVPDARPRSLFRALAAGPIDLGSCDGFVVMRDGAAVGTVVEPAASPAADGRPELFIRGPGRLFASRVRIDPDEVVAVDAVLRKLTLRSIGHRMG